MTNQQPQDINRILAESSTPSAPRPPMASSSAPAGYDRHSELRAFDDTKAGVKGLVDAGVSAVPRIFHHQAAPEPEEPPSPPHHNNIVPVIDLAATARPELVSQVKAAVETVGFFQVLNHGVPGDLLAETLASIRKFHEAPAEAKRPYYTRDPARRVRYQSNFDLFQSPAANWRDTLYLYEDQMSPEEAEMPPPCRGGAVAEYARHVRRLGAALLELLSEAHGLHGGYLEHDAGGLDALVVAGNYYPPCPEPHLTLGATRHSDPSFLTVLLQDGVGGLQVLVDDGGCRRRWVDVAPVPGALVVNVGDFLQLLSNDRFRSVEHRVLATAAGPRVSVACFFRTNHGDDGRVYGPIIAGDERPRYRSITAHEYVGYYRDKGLDGRSALDHFRL